MKAGERVEPVGDERLEAGIEAWHTHHLGMIEAGLVATGMRGFWVRAVVGLVFLAAVVFHLSMEDPMRRREAPEHGRNGPEPLPNEDQTRRYLRRVD